MNQLADYGKQQVKNTVKTAVKKALKSFLKNPYVLGTIAALSFAILVLFAIIGAAGSAEASEGTISANSDYVVKTDEANSAPVITDIETLQEAFSGYPTNSKLIENAQAFLDMQETYKVNAIFCAAVAIQETTAGTNGTYALDGHNWFNYMPISGIDQLDGYLGTQSSWCKWDTDVHGIMGFGYYISQHSSLYFSQGEYTVSAIGSHYCVPPDDWITGVQGYMTDLYEAAGITISSFSINEDFYNSDGSVDETKLLEHQRGLEGYFGLPTGNISTAWQDISVSGYTPTAEARSLNIAGLSSYQCTWWVHVRANYYLQSQGKDTLPNRRYGNGIEVAGNLTQYFNSGSTPRPNSVFSMTSSSSYRTCSVC